ncbi:dienelactone hydrolase family protein [Flavivirga spongiicola]|uniref:Dienelactone hydrolase family protein n=1 Tax=Flavivirga spongiicola TaxID=421621 RepID=A0ABU7XXZ4_9FLAO|nr:dienelactone hydrolase family protein [Flavivirga sp. MEBiC05379]MDO5980664.1 dienelactone hydrolase family protein [Flavivirga sp. MEBiC05379]
MNKFLIFVAFLFFVNVAFCQKKYKVVLPDNYNEMQVYPLFIVFHGGNSSMENTMLWWTSNKLTKEFIVAYFEATTLDNPPNRWGWRNLPKERENIKQYYSEIVKTYSVEDDIVYVGGFSLGGKLSVDLALNQILPVKGVISLNHGGGTTEFFTPENIKEASKSNIKAILLTGENDYRYRKETLNIKEQFEKYRLQHRFIEIKDLGHAVPKNFNKALDSYLSFIMD